MHAYEIIFILRPDLNDNEKTEIFNKLKDTLNKFNAKIKSANVWAEKRKLYFDLSAKGKSVKFREGLYYLIEFDCPALEIEKLKAAYEINEDILRYMISLKKQDQEGV